MNLILEGSKQMPFYTDMKLVFDSLKGKQKEFNWLITDIDCNQYPSDILERDIVWITGEELTDIVYKNNIQFIWGVFSAFPKNIEIDINNLEVVPYADGNPSFWSENPKIQHPKAVAEIVCWDSTLALMLSKDNDLADMFQEYFVDAKILEEYNRDMYLYGDIVPDKRIGQFLLGSKLEELKEQINFKYTLKELGQDCIVLEGENIDFYFKKEGNDYIAYMIRVFNNFKGKFLGKIGVGSTLSNYKEILEYEYDDFLLHSYHWYYFISSKFPGIKFCTEKPWDDNTTIHHIDVEKA